MSEETSPRQGIGRWLNMNLVGALLLIGATVMMPPALPPVTYRRPSAVMPFATRASTPSMTSW